MSIEKNMKISTYGKKRLFGINERKKIPTFCKR